MAPFNALKPTKMKLLLYILVFIMAAILPFRI